uniref:Integrin, alpha 5 (fibronectin receptor, alpha polypeptide) n=1 Tax=Paramormyrops kingsleyae TaxID=1676925 RepID=A0A3B3T2N2_9TELE
MGSKKHRSKNSAKIFSRRLEHAAIVCLFVVASVQLSSAFNLDTENPTVYSGANGSYFGYAVEFYMTNSSFSILVGAPKANTNQPNITEGGSVYYCPWGLGQSHCNTIEFDNQGNRMGIINDTYVQMEMKSHQWFGATVRSHGNTILACAPLYNWRTMNDVAHSDVTGSCYLSVDNVTKFVEYAPCRSGILLSDLWSGRVVLGGPGSFFWQGQLFSASKDEIVKAYYPDYFRLPVTGQIQTKQAQANYDDSYLGIFFLFYPSQAHGGDVPFVTLAPAVPLLMLPFSPLLPGSSPSWDDLLVSAPMFMVRGSGSRLEEMGRVYVYLQRRPLELEHSQSHLTGSQAYGRFGSSIAPLGDLNQDGFNDVAISSPFGGENQQGLVFIYNGHSGGLKDTPSQVLVGQWASSTLPASFGSAIRGNKDVDMNGYPDLLVGAFGVDKAVLYRARPIVKTSASLTVSPTMINPEEKSCVLTNGNETILVSCVNLSFCLSASGRHLPDELDFVAEVQLDRQKQKQKGAVRRALFLDTQQPTMRQDLRLLPGARVCHETKFYLRDEKDFRDKLSAIYIGLNFSLNPHTAADAHGLRPIINYQTADLIEQKVFLHPSVDCLLFVPCSDRREVYLGDDNALTLTFSARNEGEGGAYEAELYVVLPPEADYSGIARNNESLTQLTCSYETENQTRYLSCDLGNPMKAGMSLWAGLRFTVPRLKDTRRMVQFDFQIRSKNENNSQSDVVPYKLDVIVQADVILQGVSRPDKVFFPPPHWKATKRWQMEKDIGPSVQHVYELVNNGPSRISHTVLELRCPKMIQGHLLLYPLEVMTQGSVNCSTNSTINPRQLKVRASYQALQHELCSEMCLNVFFLNTPVFSIQRTYKNYVLECSAQFRVLKMPYAIAPRDVPSGARHVVTSLVWSKPDSQYPVPLWIIILAILAGLLLLALLIYVLYKLDFFKRSLPYGTAMEKAQLKPQAASDA